MALKSSGPGIFALELGVLELGVLGRGVLGRGVGVAAPGFALALELVSAIAAPAANKPSSNFGTI